jgi:hypothetical protein
MDSFFRPGSFPCPIYCRTRDKTDEYNTSGRAFIETLWRDYATFLDPDVLQRATLNMPAVFWELYVAQALHSSGINLQSQARTRLREIRRAHLAAATPCSGLCPAQATS